MGSVALARLAGGRIPVSGPRGGATDSVSLHQRNVPASSGQFPGDAQTDHTAPDDHCVGLFRHGGDCAVPNGGVRMASISSLSPRC